MPDTPRLSESFHVDPAPDADPSVLIMYALPTNAYSSEQCEWVLIAPVTGEMLAAGLLPVNQDELRMMARSYAIGFRLGHKAAALESLRRSATPIPVDLS